MIFFSFTRLTTFILLKSLKKCSDCELFSSLYCVIHCCDVTNYNCLRKTPPGALCFRDPCYNKQCQFAWNPFRPIGLERRIPGCWFGWAILVQREHSRGALWMSRTGRRGRFARAPRSEGIWPANPAFPTGSWTRGSGACRGLPFRSWRPSPSRSRRWPRPGRRRRSGRPLCQSVGCRSWAPVAA